MSDDGRGSTESGDDGDDNSVFRRDVLEASGATAVAPGLGGGGCASSLAETVTEPASGQNPGIKSYVGQDEVTRATCMPNCHRKCPLETYVRDGRARKIEPQISEDE